MGFQTLLDAKEKLKIMFKEGDNTIKGCGMDQLDENGEELYLKKIYAQATHQFGVAIKGLLWSNYRCIWWILHLNPNMVVGVAFCLHLNWGNFVVSMIVLLTLQRDISNLSNLNNLKVITYYVVKTCWISMLSQAKLIIAKCNIFFNDEDE